MPDWRHNIDELLKSQGFEKKAPELSADDESVIQEFLDNIGRPAFENIPSGYFEVAHYSDA